jgi:Holliday junction resolvase RusA-like endonuclease
VPATGSECWHKEVSVAVQPVVEPKLPLRFSVDGEAAPQGSKRHVGKGVMIEQVGRSRPWREAVAWAARNAAGPNWQVLRGPVEIELLYRFARPKLHYGSGRNRDKLRPSAPEYKQTYPDLDKLARNTLDALVQAGIFANDSQVAVLICEKRWGERSGLHVRVRPLDAVGS